jgi:hypothetical protein
LSDQQARSPDNWNSDDRLAIIKRNITEIGVDEMCKYVRDCTAVASCLGHNLTWKGIFGKPRKLVTDSVRVLCEAVQRNSPEKPNQIYSDEYYRQQQQRHS